MAVVSRVTQADGRQTPKRPRDGGPVAGIGAHTQQHPAALNSADLLAGHREVVIDHDGELYRLRHTKNGKLILNK